MVDTFLASLNKARNDHPFLPFKIMVRGDSKSKDDEWYLGHVSMVSVDAYWVDDGRAKMWLKADNEDDLREIFEEEVYHGNGDDMDERFTEWFEYLPWERAIIIWIE